MIKQAEIDVTEYLFPDHEPSYARLAGLIIETDIPIGGFPVLTREEKFLMRDKRAQQRQVTTYD